MPMRACTRAALSRAKGPIWPWTRSAKPMCRCCADRCMPMATFFDTGDALLMQAETGLTLDQAQAAEVLVFDLEF